MHDRDGKELSVGDTVVVPAIVRSISSAGEEYCNVTLETIKPMYPGTSPSALSLNAKQVVKAAVPKKQ